MTVVPVIEGESEVVVEADVGCGNINPLEVDPVSVGDPESDPVQLAPVGQHAMWLAASSEHIVPSRQHAPEFPRSVHALYPDGQLSSRFNKISRTSAALFSIVGSDHGG